MAYILVLVFLAGLAKAQDVNEQHFVEIIHSADGTEAVDSTGQRWIYDAEEGHFVPSDSRRPEGRGEINRDQDYLNDIYLPAEIRCTNIHNGDIEKLFDKVHVEKDQRIEGSIFSGRDIVIDGLVTGDVLSLKTVYVNAGGEVRGDVVGKEIKCSRDGKIFGTRNEIPFPAVIPPLEIPTIRIFSGISAIFFTAFIIFICAAVLAVASPPILRIKEKLDLHPIKTFFIGIVGWFSVIPIAVLLIITIIGIPVAILIYPIVLLVAIVLSFVTAAVYIGERVGPRLGYQGESIYLKGIIGILVVEILQVFSGFLTSIGISGLSSFFGVIYYIIVGLTLTVGFGAVISTRFGFKSKDKKITEDKSCATIVVPCPVTPPSIISEPVPPPPTPPPSPQNDQLDEDQDNLDSGDPKK